MIFIVGPTCSGKTSTSIELAKKIKGAEIISADSRQVYKYFSVGTAKPAGKWEPLKGKLAFFCEGIAHHLVDFLDPGNYFSAGSFAELASEKAAEIKKRGGTPVFVGGTGLYIDSFINGIAAMPQRDETIREELLKLEKKRGRAYLHKKLEEADPISAKNIHPNNIHRVIRALEIFRITGRPISELHKTDRLSRAGKKEKHSIFGLKLDRAELYEKINKRVEWMLENGMVEETKQILSLGYNLENSPALKSVGYPHVIEFLENRLPFEKMKSLIQQDTRNYAKRQMTWFNRNKDINWVAKEDIWKKL